MKKYIIGLIMSFGILHAQVTPVAQSNTVLVADDSSSGTYKLLIKEIAGETTGIINFQEVGNKGGAVGNLQALLDNKASMALMHADVLKFKEQADPTISQRFRTLLTLHSEDIHFIALTQSKHVTSNSWTFSKTYANLNNIDDLKQGFKVGAAGGGFISIQIIKGMLGLSYDVVQYDSGDQVLAALANGDIDCAVFVGAAPLPNLVNLNSQYKLLTVPDSDVTRLSTIYHRTTITYPQMSPNSIATIAPDCLLVARVYKSPKFIQVLDTFRQTFYKNLTDLQETPGNASAWQEVIANNHGKMPWLKLPSDAPVTSDDTEE